MNQLHVPSPTFKTSCGYRARPTGEHLGIVVHLVPILGSELQIFLRDLYCDERAGNPHDPRLKALNENAVKEEQEEVTDIFCDSKDGACAIDLNRQLLEVRKGPGKIENLIEFRA